MEKSVHSAEQKILQELLIELRIKAGLRQSDLAERLDRPQPFVSRVETGEKMLDLPELRQVCKALEITLIEFVMLYEARIQGLLR